MHRRLFLAMAGGLLGAAGCGCGAHAIEASTGCVLSEDEARTKRLVGIAGREAEGYGVPKMRVFQSTGAEGFDRAMGRMLLHIADVFDVYPGCAFFEDGRKENAFATPQTFVSGTSGTVMVGLTLLHKTMAQARDGDIAVMGVCAHEFGHIFQMKTGWLRRLKDGYPTVMYAELQADFLAGYFVAQRRKRFPDFGLGGLRRKFKQIGDLAVNNRGHHGTPDQRLSALEAGYSLGTTPETDMGRVAEAGAKFALSL